MFLVNKTQVENYIKKDKVSDWLSGFGTDNDELLVCQGWLRKTPAKRFIFDEMYGDLLINEKHWKILDVGGGLTGLSRALVERHNYVVVDLLAHDDLSAASQMEDEVGAEFIRAQDWATLEPDTYDLVIANDIFPNVDQRLEMFLEKFLSETKMIRLSLTFYDVPRFYMTKRVDAEELLCMLAWNGEHLKSVLAKYVKNIVNADFEVFSCPGDSAYPNGRQVCVVNLLGNMSEKDVS